MAEIRTRPNDFVELRRVIAQISNELPNKKELPEEELAANATLADVIVAVNKILKSLR